MKKELFINIYSSVSLTIKPLSVSQHMCCFGTAGATHHSVLRIGLLVVHLSDLLLCGAVDLTQDAEPLAVCTRTSSVSNTQNERQPKSPPGGGPAPTYEALLTWRPRPTLQSGGTSSLALRCWFRSPSPCYQRFPCVTENTTTLLSVVWLITTQP